MTAVVVPLVGESDGNSIAADRPELLDEPVLELPVPFAPQELLDGLTAGDEFGPVAPDAVDRVSERHSFRITGVPGVFGQAHLLDGGVAVERWKWWTSLLGFHGILLLRIRADFNRGIQSVAAGDRRVARVLGERHDPTCGGYRVQLLQGLR